MNISVPELSKRFLRALDSNYNVVDERSVYEIISTLEGTRVTRELLEATRLAKHINELRRKTKDQVLARRSKSLLKRWREMLLPAGVPNNATTTSTQSSSSSVPSSPALNRPTNQNGALNSTPSPRGPGRPPKNQTHVVQSSLSSSSIQPHINSSSNSSNNVHKLAAFSQSQQQQQLHGKHKENHVNNNSLRVPPPTNFASTSQSQSQMLGIKSLMTTPRPTSETEVINLTDERSNSPSMFQNYQKRLQQQQQQQVASPHSKKMRLNQQSEDKNSLAVPPSSANSNNHHTFMSSSASLPASNLQMNLQQQQQRLLLNTPFNNSGLISSSCDNNILDFDNSNNLNNQLCISNNNSSSSTNRKHKKHKKEKSSRPPELLITPSKSMSSYNHMAPMLMDDHSAPNLLRDRDDSTGNLFARTGTTNSLILPDNDSLSNTSASMFNNNFPNNSTETPSSLPARSLSFAGHFSKATGPNEISPSSLQVINNNIKQSHSRSVSPSSFMSHHSNHSMAQVPVVTPDPDVILVNSHSQDAVPVNAGINTQSQLTSPQDPKIPKKRGRKKGSKGIDSLLATQNEGSIQQIFNDSFSELKQKITSISGNKKVKTTKEILSDIQNKRSASGSTVTSPSVTQAPSPDSAMSEISHHSQPSTRTVTPEPIAGPSQLPAVKEEEEPETKPVTTTPSTSKITLNEDVELTIKRLLSQLPPITKKKTDYDHVMSDDDDENDTDEDDGSPKCTCTLREVKEGEEETEQETSNKKIDDEQKNSVNIEINIIKDSDEELADAERERLKLRAGRKRKREKAVKSIFDLDDDNDEDAAQVGEMSDSDDLESVPDENHPAKEVIDVLATGELLSQQERTNAISNPVLAGPDDVNPENQQEMMPQFAKYEAVIDPDCAALRFYETDRNEITNFHIEMLENRYVPNVNGNWNQRIVAMSETKKEQNEDDPESVSIETANDVVPRYNFLVCHKIPKQFPDFEFDYKTDKAKYRERARMRRKEAKIAAAKKQNHIKTEEDSDEEANDVPVNGNGDGQLSEKDESTSDIEMGSPQEQKPSLTIENPEISHNNDHESEDSDADLEHETELPDSNNFKLPSFNHLAPENETGKQPDTNLEFSEWYQSVQAVSNGEDLIILPYVVID
uniref:Mediator of RNA polymerase II transcription subunit 26 n=1 Tax=Culicoides sonorensis TaxID=179676 RepID=A0A336ME32_CULSO